MNGDGVICMGAVDAGNASDKTLNRRAITELAAAFSPEAMRDLICVADSSLVNEDNFAAVHAMDLPLITRCPESYGAAGEAKADAWHDIGTVAERRNAAHYWASEQTDTLYGIPYRFIVDRSSALALGKPRSSTATSPRRASA